MAPRLPAPRAQGWRGIAISVASGARVAFRNQLADKAAQCWRALPSWSALPVLGAHWWKILRCAWWLLFLTERILIHVRRPLQSLDSPLRGDFLHERIFSGRFFVLGHRSK